MTADDGWQCADTPDDVIAALGAGLEWQGKAGFQSRGIALWRLEIEAVVAVGKREIRLHGKREFNMSQLWVEHGNIETSPTGAGVGTLFVRNSMKLYKNCGFHTVRITASGSVGGYVWARLGFVPTQSDWDRIRQEIAQDIASISNVPAAEQATLQAAVGSDDPHAIWSVAACEVKLGNDEYSLGKRLLLGTTWAGVFNLNDSDAWALLEEVNG